MPCEIESTFKLNILLHLIHKLQCGIHNLITFRFKNPGGVKASKRGIKKRFSLRFSKTVLRFGARLQGWLFDIHKMLNKTKQFGISVSKVDELPEACLRAVFPKLNSTFKLSILPDLIHLSNKLRCRNTQPYYLSSSKMQKELNIANKTITVFLKLIGGTPYLHSRVSNAVTFRHPGVNIDLRIKTNCVSIVSSR